MLNVVDIEYIVNGIIKRANYGGIRTDDYGGLRIPSYGGVDPPPLWQTIEFKRLEFCDMVVLVAMYKTIGRTTSNDYIRGLGYDQAHA